MDNQNQQAEARFSSGKKILYLAVFIVLIVSFIASLSFFLFKAVENKNTSGIEQSLTITPIQNLGTSEPEKNRIDQWIEENNLNEFGDPKDSNYTGGTPLFDEAGGKTTDLYEYIIRKHLDKPWDKAENTDTNWQTYKNEEFGFEFEYPKEATKSSSVFKHGIVRFQLSKEDGTNLSAKYMEIIAKSANAKEQCLNPSQTIIERTEKAKIGNIEFTKETGADSGAGTKYKTISYSVFHDQNCVSFVFGLNIANIDNYAPSVRLKEFDREKEAGVFDQIISTFRFVE